MSEAISVTKESLLSDLRMERSESGRIVTPWLTFKWQAPGIKAPAVIGSRYHHIIELSKRAFTQALGLPDHAWQQGLVIVTQKKDPVDGEFWWRLSTAYPMELPKPPKIEKPVLPENRGAIDI